MPPPLRPKGDAAVKATSFVPSNPAGASRRTNASRACRHCRAKRIKCSGKTPCPSCQELGIECEIVTEDDGRRRTRESGALALELSQSEHRNAGLAKELAKYRQILKRQQRASTPEFDELVSRIQSEESTQDLIESVVTQINDAAQLPGGARAGARSGAATGSDRELLDQLLLFLRRADEVSSLRLTALIQRGASEKEILAYFATESRRKEILGKRRRHLSVSSLCENPLYSLRARPWTSVFDDDTLISHLVSLFFTWVNPFHPLVDEATFIHAMKSGQKPNPYCNDALVNAILSLGCHSSNDPAAFANPDDVSTRGQHFLDESVRLWEASPQRSSTLNLQTLTALMLAATMAGSDSKYMKYLDQMSSMRDRIERNLPARLKTTPPAHLDDEDRVGVFALWNCLKIQTIWGILFPRPTLINVPRLGIEQYCEVQYESLWYLYPFEGTPRHVATGVLEHQECKLHIIVAGLLQVMYKASELFMAELLSLVKEYDARLQVWYSNLPDECQRISKRFGCSARALNLECQYLHIRFQLVLILNKAQNAHKASAERDEFTKSVVADSSQMTEEVVKLLDERFPKRGVLAFLPAACFAGALASISFLEDEAYQQYFHIFVAHILDAAAWIFVYQGIVRLILIEVRMAGKRVPQATRLLLAELSFDSWDFKDKLFSEFQIMGTHTEAESLDGLSGLLEKWSDFTLSAEEDDDSKDDDDDNEGSGTKPTGPHKTVETSKKQ